MNCQSPYVNDFTELTNARVWVLDVYDGVYFNVDVSSKLFLKKFSMGISIILLSMG